MKAKIDHNENNKTTEILNICFCFYVAHHCNINFLLSIDNNLFNQNMHTYTIHT